MSEFAYNGFNITSTATKIIVDHGYYGPVGTRRSKEAFPIAELINVALECDSAAVSVALMDGRTYRFGPLPGLESQNIFWIESINGITPHSVDGDYAAKTLALYNAIYALM